MEEKVITPPRGGHPAPEPQGSPRGVRAVPNPFPKIFPEDSLRDGGLDRQKDIGYASEHGGTNAEGHSDTP